MQMIGIYENTIEWRNNNDKNQINDMSLEKILFQLNYIQYPIKLFN